jgi:tetratricopeptide (TPR) repeat protein
MNKIRFSVLAALLVVGNMATAQTVEQAKKFYYYERYKSAQETLEKVLAANPNNIDAVYWLGETMVHRKDTRDTVGAKALFQKMLQTNGSAPLLLVGMGHIELMYGNTTDSRQRFETAISLTKAKDINVLNAVGYANVDAKAGDANYAIEKLTLATQIKNFNNAQTYVLIGDAYRKLVDGGNAVTNYQKALMMDPKLAEARYKIGLIYLSQNNREYFLPAFEDAIKLDPAYAPAYNILFVYYASRDVNKAATYLDKYIENTDPGPEVDYLKTDLLYSSSKFAEARTRAQALIAQLGDKVSPRMYRMLAYTSDTLGDYPAAKAAMTTFFNKADTSMIIGADYEGLAKINGNLPDTPTKNSAFQYYKLAVQRDTLAENRARYAQEASDLAKKLGNKPAAADMAALVYKTTKNPDQADLYKWGFANYSAGNYKTADSIFCGIYETKYPDQIYGYLWCAKSKLAEDDSLSTQGLAVVPYQQLAEKAKSIDSVKYKNAIIEAYFYLAGYYNNVKKDKKTAIEYLQKVLDIDPGNATADKFKKILEKPAKILTPEKKPKAGTSSK